MARSDDHTVLGRATLILEVVEAAGCLSQAELVRRTAMPKPTVRRIAEQLVVRDLLGRTPDGYELGPALVTLGTAAAQRQHRQVAATPFVDDLSTRSGETAFILSVARDLSLVTAHVAFAPGSDPAIEFPGSVPPTGESLLTAAGRVAYAARPELVDELLRSGVRRRTPRSTPTRRALEATLAATADLGASVEHDEHTLGWSCIAAGVRDSSGRVVEVVGVLGRSGSWRPDHLRAPLKYASEQLASTLREHEVVTSSPWRPVPGRGVTQ
ncbi:MAG: IclR family transcriptional regulator C-terminal domain-containing protein [Brevundimonas sp.]